ncbi:MAG: AhpC/TSA family protein [Bacteroidaceae bacterium]|nr:AhpC/TSA family protein [Bacteroidaceae bacterium]
MKKNIIVASTSLVLALAACEESGEHFQIKGEIGGAADKVLYFEASALDGIKVLDSLKLDKQGSFAFTGKRPDGPEFYRLRVGGQVINLGIDSTEVVTVKGEMPSLTANYVVEGSEESVKIKELSAKQADLQEQIRRLAASQMPIGDYRERVNRMVEEYKQQICFDYIYSNPRSGYAYYALFQRINGTLLFDPESSREDVRAFGAVATSWDMYYPHSLRTVNLHNIAMRGMKNTRKPSATPFPEELIREVTLLDLALPDLRGATRRLTDLKGKVVLLDFTIYQNQASPARNIALRELYDKYASQGFEIYQVSYDVDEHFWKTSADNLPWICVRDAEGGSAVTYRVDGLPTYFLIDRANGLYKRNIDIEDTKQLESEIKKLLRG